jgi:Secretion system C-terminal sorting domain
MKKFFTKMCLIVALALSVTVAHAQFIWPTADTNTIRVSQFADASTIRAVKADTALSANLANFKGWLTMGINSKTPAKVDSAVWLWTGTGHSAIGAYGGTIVMKNTDTTRGRGLAIFSSDFLDNRGVAGNFGNGPAASPQKGELWSPIIDATGLTNLKVYFNSMYRHFRSGDSIPCHASSGISWSEDGGVTWKPIICISENDGFGTNEGQHNDGLSVKLNGSKGTSKFRFKFIFDGDYYFWTVDDVKLGAPKYDLRVSPDWIALPPNYVQMNNIDSLRFMCDVINNGSAIAKNVKLTASVIDNATQAVVYSFTRNYGDLKADSIAENELVGPGYVLPSTVKIYNVRYSLTADSTDAFSTDNSITFSGDYGINVRDSLARMDRNDVRPTGTFLYKAGYALNYQGTGTRTYSVGNYYYFPKGSTSTAVRIRAYLGEVSAASITAARPYITYLYEWNDTNKNDSIESTERKLIAAGEASAASGADPGVPLDFRLQSFIDNKPVILKDNQAYIAMFEVMPTTAGTTWYAGFDDRMKFDYSAMHYAHKKAGKPRFSGVYAATGDQNLTWTTKLGGQGNYSPKVSLYAYPFRVGTKDNLPSTYKVDIYPNPVGNNLNITIDFPKSEEAVLFRIFDLRGQLIQEREFMNVQKETLNMDINTLASGNYLLQVQTLGNQAKTIKFVKAN